MMNYTDELAYRVWQFATSRYEELWDFLPELGFTIHTNNAGKRFALREGTDPVLAVAHLDTVLDRPDLYNREDYFVESPELDDRIGLSMIFALIDRGVWNPTILFCDDEEIGQSTAAQFIDAWYAGDCDIPDINWIVEFDRMGLDCVTYEYRCPVWQHMVDIFAPDGLGVGSFTDICELEELGVSGVNWATGYHRQHTKHCYTSLIDTEQALSAFADFFRYNVSHRYEHRMRTYQASFESSWSPADVDKYRGFSIRDNPLEDAAVDVKCDICGQWVSEDEAEDYDQCPECGISPFKSWEG